MPELDPDMSITETTNDCASKSNSEHHRVGAIEPFSTPMPSVQCVLDDIDQTYGHMPPLPPSELALKLKILRETVQIFPRLLPIKKLISIHVLLIQTMILILQIKNVLPILGLLIENLYLSPKNGVIILPNQKIIMGVK